MNDSDRRHHLQHRLYEAEATITRLHSALATARREALEEAAVMRNALLPFARFAEYIEAGRPGWYHNGFALIDDERMPPLQMSVFINARRALLSQSVEVGRAEPRGEEHRRVSRNTDADRIRTTTGARHTPRLAEEPEDDQ